MHSAASFLTFNFFLIPEIPNFAGRNTRTPPMQNRTRTLTEAEAFQKLSALCAAAEYCRSDIWRKMGNWQIADDPGPDAEAKQRILDRLLREGYIDEARYACAFVRDKFRYNRWGRTRIRQELRLRGIDPDTVARALQELPDDDEQEALRQLLARKRPTVRGKNDREINLKLIRFALSRGFSMDLIGKVLQTEV